MSTGTEIGISVQHQSSTRKADFSMKREDSLTNATQKRDEYLEKAKHVFTFDWFPRFDPSEDIESVCPAQDEVAILEIVSRFVSEKPEFKEWEKRMVRWRSERFPSGKMSVKTDEWNS